MKEKTYEIKKRDNRLSNHSKIIYFDNKNITELHVSTLILKNDLSQIYELIKEISERDKAILNLKKIRSFIEEFFVPAWISGGNMDRVKINRLERDIRKLNEKIKKKQQSGDKILKNNKRIKKEINDLENQNQNSYIIKERIKQKKQEIQINLFELRINHEEEEMLKYKRKIKEEELNDEQATYLYCLDIITKANETMVIIEYFLSELPIT